MFVRETEYYLACYTETYEEIDRIFGDVALIEKVQEKDPKLGWYYIYGWVQDLKNGYIKLIDPAEIVITDKDRYYGAVDVIHDDWIKIIEPSIILTWTDEQFEDYLDIIINSRGGSKSLTMPSDLDYPYLRGMIQARVFEKTRRGTLRPGSRYNGYMMNKKFLKKLKGIDKNNFCAFMALEMHMDKQGIKEIAVGEDFFFAMEPFGVYEGISEEGGVITCRRIK